MVYRTGVIEAVFERLDGVGGGAWTGAPHALGMFDCEAEFGLGAFIFGICRRCNRQRCLGLLGELFGKEVDGF